MSPRTGRPKSDNPKTERLFIRVTQEDKKNIKSTISPLLSNLCNDTILL